MGIRKHFEKKSPDEDLKLQDLAVEQETTPELKFDPEIEITESDWQGILGLLNALRKLNRWLDFAQQAMYIKILQPDKAADLNIDPKAWQRKLDV